MTVGFDVSAGRSFDSVRDFSVSGDTLTINWQRRMVVV